MEFCLKTYISISFLLFLSVNMEAQEQSSINVKLYQQKGLPHAQVSIILNPTKDTVTHKGVPVDLDLYNIQEICFNRHQKNYEQYQDGIITKQEYQINQQSNRDTSILSATRYKHTVYVLVGFNTAGKKVVIFDQNQNNDFSDEHAFEFDTTFYSLPINERDKIEANLPAIELNYEFFDGHQLLKRKTSLKFDPYRIYRLKREKNEKEKALELRMIEHEYLEGKFNLAGKPYKTVIFSKIPNAATYLNQHIRIWITEELGTYSGAETIRRKDTFLLDDKLLVIHGPSMFGDSMQITNLGNQFKPYGFRKGFYVRDMTFLYLDNTSQRLYEQLKDGNYVILDFWGTWCQPCLKLMPQIQELHTRLGKVKNVKMIGIAYDEDISKVLKTVEQFNMTWLNAFDDSHLKDNTSSPVKQLNVTGFPAVFLIQPDGKIIATSLPEINKWIDEKE